MTNIAKQKILRQETQARFPFLIEIKHYTTSSSDVYTTYRYCNSDEDIVFENETFNACVFSIEPPEKKTDGFSDSKLNISIIDQEWIDKIRNTPVDAPRSKIRFVASIQYYDTETVTEPIEDTEFILTNASWNDGVVQWTMKFDDILDEIIPYDICNVYLCPALM